MALGKDVLEFRAGRGLVVNVQVPVVSQVTCASRERPYLALALDLDPSSFHQHFKAVTSYSPLQFQKHLRLLEARRLMMSEGITARRAAFVVGYESTSQFSRDYAKRFGLPPRRETQASRPAT